MKRQAIFAIVDKGYAETVVEAQKKRCAGATVVNARGAGIMKPRVCSPWRLNPKRRSFYSGGNRPVRGDHGCGTSGNRSG
jgi:hypothetical protein